jgi:hypothetical protein
MKVEEQPVSDKVSRVNSVPRIGIDGHTPGFTAYIHSDVLFVCDLVFVESDGMRFNPYGPKEATRQGRGKTLEDHREPGTCQGVRLGLCG